MIRPTHRARHWLGRVGLGMASLLLLEWGLRFALSDITTTAQYSYFSERWIASDAVHTNRLGFREREFEAIPASSVCRICMVGDSFLFGQGLPVAARLSNILDAQLNSGAAEVEVLNFGAKGANLAEYLEVLDNDVLPTNPNVVLLQWFINDADSEQHPYPSAARLLPWRVGDRFLTRHSALWSLAGIAFDRVALGVGMRDHYWDFTQALLSDENGSPARAARDHLRAFVEACQAAGVPVGIILFPDLGVDVGNDYPLGFLMDRAAAQCRELGVPYIDLRTVFRQVPPPHRARLCLNWLDGHPSKFANELASRRVYDWLPPLLEQVQR
jgi:hypothetical protein